MDALKLCGDCKQMISEVCIEHVKRVEANYVACVFFKRIKSEFADNYRASATCRIQEISAA